MAAIEPARARGFQPRIARPRSAFQNRACDRLGELLPVGGLIAAGGVLAIGEEPAFGEDGGNTRLAQNVVRAAFDTPVLAGVQRREIRLHAGGDPGRLAVEIVGFKPVGASADGGIEMDADKQGVAVGVGDGDPLAKRDERVIATRHHRLHVVLLKNGAKALRDIQGERLFARVIAGGAAPVMAAVSGVDHHGFRNRTESGGASGDSREREEEEIFHARE